MGLPLGGRILSRLADSSAPERWIPARALALLEAPNSAAYLDTYGWILYLKGDYKAAEAQLGKAVENGGTGEVLEHYGDVWLKLGDENKARDFWKKAIDSGSKDLDIEEKLRNARN